MNLIGARLSLVEPGLVEITLPYRADLTQHHGYLHAGVVTTIAIAGNADRELVATMQGTMMCMQKRD